MLKVKNEQIYHAFGLWIKSEISFPELNSVEMSKEKTDVEIRIKGIDDFKKELESNPYQHYVVDGQVMFNVPEVANFYIRDGKKVVVSPLAGAEEDVLRLYLLGTCMGAVLMQRKILPLHGSAIEIAGKAYAIVGDSGAGKSTLASAFLKRGYKLVSDDVIAVYPADGDFTQPYVVPSYPQQKLWQESLDMFRMESKEYRSIYGRETKYCIPVTEHFVNAPLPLAGVIELVKSEEATHLCKMNKLDSIHTFLKNTYRNFLIPRLELTEWHFRTCTNILEYVDAHRLHRLTTGSSTDKLITRILDSINRKDEKDESETNLTTGSC